MFDDLIHGYQSRLDYDAAARELSLGFGAHDATCG